jgi:hypothetical protein
MAFTANTRRRAACSKVSVYRLSKALARANRAANKVNKVLSPPRDKELPILQRSVEGETTDGVRNSGQHGSMVVEIDNQRANQTLPMAHEAHVESLHCNSFRWPTNWHSCCY